MLNTRGTGVWNLLDKGLKHSLHKKKKNTEIRIEYITVSWVIIPLVVSTEQQPAAQQNYQNLPNTVCHLETILS